MFNGLAQFLHHVLSQQPTAHVTVPQKPTQPTITTPQQLQTIYNNTFGAQRMAGNFKIGGTYPGALAHPMTPNTNGRMSIVVPDNTVRSPNYAQQIYHAQSVPDQAHGIVNNYNHLNTLIPNAIKPDASYRVKGFI